MSSADRVMESSPTTGLGSFSLGGAVGSSRTFAQKFADGATVEYWVSNADQSKFEHIVDGILTYGTPPTLSRGSGPEDSSNADAAIDWQSSDTKYIYTIASAAALSGLGAGSLATSRPWWVAPGGSWWDYSAGLGTSWIQNLAADLSTDVHTGFYDAVKALFFPDNRRRSIAVGAANKVFAATDVGGSFTFSTSGGARTATLPASATAKDGYHVELRGLSTANGIILTPAAGDGIDGGADAATKTIPGGVLFTVRWSAADDMWVTNYKAPAATTYPLGTIYGLTYANNVADATNDIDIAAGGCMDATGAYLMVLSALTKQLDVAWAVGTNAGGLDTGAVGNSDYYVWAIGRTDGTVNDILFSLSSTAPTMPTNYTFKRLIGWFKRVGGTNVALKTWETAGGGLAFRWTTPTLDVSLASTLTTTRRTDAVKVPLNFETEALVRVVITDPSSIFKAVVCSPGEADGAPSVTVAPLANIVRDAGGTDAASDFTIRTDNTGKIAARSTLATTGLYAVLTLGFSWSRR